MLPSIVHDRGVVVRSVEVVGVDHPEVMLHSCKASQSTLHKQEILSLIMLYTFFKLCVLKYFKFTTCLHDDTQLRYYNNVSR